MAAAGLQEVGLADRAVLGQAVGRGDAAGARQASRAALVCGVAFMTASAVVMLLVPDGLARIYSSEPEVLAAAILLIPIAGVFQVFDGIQVVAPDLGDAACQLLDRLASQPPPEVKLRRCKVLYVSPLKALAVDVERNLRAPLAGIANAAMTRGDAYLETGDIAAARLLFERAAVAGFGMPGGIQQLVADRSRRRRR